MVKKPSKKKIKTQFTNQIYGTLKNTIYKSDLIIESICVKSGVSLCSGFGSPYTAFLSVP
jgi:hypothetical protein